MSPCKCSFMVGLPTCKELAATTIVPFVADGFSGSNVTVPEMPLAVPLIDSSGASVLNTTLLTPFGSLKSNSIGAARKLEAHKKRNALVINCLLITQRDYRLCVLVTKKKCQKESARPEDRSPGSRRPGQSAFQLWARQSPSRGLAQI